MLYDQGVTFLKEFVKGKRFPLGSSRTGSAKRGRLS
jgi:hypothetical protein